MTLLPPMFLDTVVAIGQAIDDDGGVAANATGTLVGWPTSKSEEGEQLYRVFLVTNRHVVEDRSGFLVRFNQGAAAEWYQVDLIDDDGSALWHGHGDAQCDIAAVSIDVAPLRAAGAEFRFLSADTIWAYQSQRDELRISAGDSVFVLGFPLGLAGTERSYVIVRGGMVARWDDEIVAQTKSFLIDANIFPGNSGGPVFICPSAMSIQGTKAVERAWLIGIVSGYIPYEDLAVSQQTGEPRMMLVENSGLASVVPLHLLQEVLEPLIQETSEPAVEMERGGEQD